MPVRNGSLFLDEALASILGQTLRDIELIVVNDHSTDDTSAILDQWSERDGRVRVLALQEQRGYTEAIKVGMTEASADLLARMDADDRSLPTRLEQQVLRFDRDAELAVLGTGVRYINGHGGVFAEESAPTGVEVGSRLRLGENMLFHPTVMMRRAAYLSVGGYRRLFEPAEDFDLWLRLAERHAVDNLPECLLDYRIHGGQVSYRRLRQQALHAAAAVHSAALRSEGKPDIYDHAVALSTRSILDAGLSLDALRATRVNAYRWMADLQQRAGLTRAAYRLRATASLQSRLIDASKALRPPIDRLAQFGPRLRSQLRHRSRSERDG